MDYASAIRQQAEDLKDELRELDIWQEEVQRQEETKKKRKVHSTNSSMIPPVRGTVPSLKEAVLKSNGKTEEDDPVKKAREQGNDFFQAGKLKEAIEAYSKGIDLDPEGSAAHVLYGNRALCYLKLEKWDDAERDASSCVRLNHSYAKGYFRRAMARKKLGNLKGARTDLEAVLALSPNDASATTEMKQVTQMLQLEREKSTPVVKKKKIVIAEVDDDDDENDGDVTSENKISEREKVETISNKYTEESEKIKIEREKEIRKEMEELNRVREVQRNLREVEAKEAERKLNATRRTCARVEVIEDEVKPVQYVDPMVETKPRETVSVEPSSVSSKPTTSESVERTKKDDIVPRTLKPSSKWSKETLKVPKSFTEFERVFSDIKNNQELCSCYISLIPPSNLRTLFGNNMTPEILLGLLNTVKLLPGTVAVAFLKGLCSVKRVEDISLFFDNSEKKVVGEVLDLIVSCGASEEDVKLFKRQLRVL